MCMYMYVHVHVLEVLTTQLALFFVSFLFGTISTLLFVSIPPDTTTVSIITITSTINTSISLLGI